MITTSNDRTGSLGYLTPKEYVDGLSFTHLNPDKAGRFGSQGNPAGSLTRGLDFLQALPEDNYYEGEGKQ